MKGTFLFIALCLMGFCLRAQTFVGTMTIGGYTRENVRVTVRPSTHENSLSLTMYDVKFARMMPVKLDVEINPVSVNGNRLNGDNIVPTNKTKRYEEYLVRDLEGVMEEERLSYTCQMGSKYLIYNGTIQR